MVTNKIDLEYVLFNSEGNIIYGENSSIQHINKLPILKGDFTIQNIDNKTLQLFNDINWIIE